MLVVSELLTWLFHCSKSYGKCIPHRQFIPFDLVDQYSMILANLNIVSKGPLWEMLQKKQSPQLPG